MIGDTSIYTLIKNEYVNTYFNRFDQSVKLDEATPKILIQNLSQSFTTTKDHSGRLENIYRIEIIGTVYVDVCTVSQVIRQMMINFTDNYIYLVEFSGSTFDTDENVKIYRQILDFRVLIN